MMIGYYWSGALGEGDVPSLAKYIADLMQYKSAPLSGLGAAYDDWAAFYNAGASATYKTAVVYCKKDSSGSPICASLAGKDAVISMQQATDALLLKIPAYNLEGAQLQLVAPDAQGSATTLTMPMPTIPNYGSGHSIVWKENDKYDGVVGPRTSYAVNIAGVLAGALKAPPADAVTALATINRADLLATQAAGIAAYFNDVTANFASLLDAYKARGMKPAATPLAPETIKQIVANVVATKGRSGAARWAAVGGGVAAACLLVGAGAFAMTQDPTGGAKGGLPSI
jgi:hypothetical protein